MLFSCTCHVGVEVLCASLLPSKRHPASRRLHQLLTSSVLSLLRVFASANGSRQSATSAAGSARCCTAAERASAVASCRETSQHSRKNSHVNCCRTNILVHMLYGRKTLLLCAVSALSATHQYHARVTIAWQNMYGIMAGCACCCLLHLCVQVQLLQAEQQVGLHSLPSSAPFGLEQLRQAAGKEHPHITQLSTSNCNTQAAPTPALPCGCMQMCRAAAHLASTASKLRDVHTFRLLAAVELHGLQSGRGCSAPLHSSAHQPVAGQPSGLCVKTAAGPLGRQQHTKHYNAVHHAYLSVPLFISTLHRCSVTARLGENHCGDVTAAANACWHHTIP